MANPLKGKKIVLGITGSIAAYKACYIIRGLIKRGAEVQVVITPAGKEFITPITLSALTSKPVISEFFAQRDGTWNSHVDLGLWADAMLIAPATASTIGKMANGVADNMLITTYLSAKSSCVCCPGNGPGYVCSSVHPKEPGDTAFVWQPYHRTGYGRACKAIW
mgnify:CR=1 FL=1